MKGARRENTRTEALVLWVVSVGAFLLIWQVIGISGDVFAITPFTEVVPELIDQLPGVSEVAVIGLPDPRWIEAVTAIIVVKAGETLDADAVVRHCAGASAHFKVPKRVVFVDSLPKNPSGKLLKRELRQQLAGSATIDGAIQKNFGT